MSLRLMPSLLVVAWIIPSLTFAQDQKHGDDPVERLLLQEKIDELAKTVKALEARQAELRKELKELEAKQAKAIASAEEKAKSILFDARIRADKITADAEAETTRFSKLVKDADPELYQFLRNLNMVKQILEDRNAVMGKIVIRDPGVFKFDSVLWDLFVEPPEQEKKAKDPGRPAKEPAAKPDRSEEYKRIWQNELLPLIRKGVDEGRIIFLDSRGATTLEILELPKRPPPKK